MKNVPTMISTKDSAYLKDMFNWNLVAFKKFNDYLDFLEDEEIIKLVNGLIELHYKNCEEIIEILEGDNDDEW